MKEEDIFEDIEIVEEELPLSYIGDEVLKIRAQEIKNINGELVEFVKRMFHTMYENNGIGLAAPQVGESKRLFIVDLTLNKEPGKKIILINPEIKEVEGEQVGEEGCLSIPGVTENVKRSYKVLIKGYTLSEKEIEIEAEGLLARVFQHELDHLDGILFIDRLSFVKKKMALKRAKKELENIKKQKKA